jgi:excisionase family DNA binding protein
MADQMYNAKEAMEKLKLPTTTFYRKVREGEIPYSGKRPNMRFPKEAVDALAELDRDAEDETQKLTFKLSTVADIWKIQELSRQLDGTRDIVPFKTVLEWRKRNPKISIHVREGDFILGWAMFLPLEEEIILNLLAERIREEDIAPQSVKKWGARRLSVYIPGIEVITTHNSIRDKAISAYLLKKTVKWALTLSSQYDIQCWYSRGTNPEGHKILAALGFKRIGTSETGKHIAYKLDNISKPSKLLAAFLQPTSNINAHL